MLPSYVPLIVGSTGGDRKAQMIMVWNSLAIPQSNFERMADIVLWIMDGGHGEHKFRHLLLFVSRIFSILKVNEGTVQFQLPPPPPAFELSATYESAKIADL